MGRAGSSSPEGPAVRITPANAAGQAVAAAGLAAARRASKQRAAAAAHPFMSVKPSTNSRQKGHFRPASGCKTGAGHATQVSHRM